LGSVLGRLAVGVLFIIAAAFAVAAIALALIDQFGHQAAYWVLALGFAIGGGLAAALLSAKEEEAAEAQAEAELTGSASGASLLLNTDTALAVATTLVPLLLRPSSVSSAFAIIKFAIRNLPLLILAAAILVLLFPFDRMRPLRGAQSPASPGT
jgi:hypothetical protein